MTWFLNTVVRTMPTRQWRKVNTVLVPRDPAVDAPRAVYARNPYNRGDDAYIAVPFDFMERVVPTLPRYLQIGGWIVESQRLIQG